MKNDRQIFHSDHHLDLLLRIDRKCLLQKIKIYIKDKFLGLIILKTEHSVLSILEKLEFLKLPEINFL